jgi:4-amino-4-deoxy-L-arabinose transferase-like glycosyltransferase
MNDLVQNSSPERYLPQKWNGRQYAFAVVLCVAVLLARVVTSGPAYFADAGNHLKAIANHTYIIQPPGYWLFNRIAGLFSNAEQGISVMNWCFSALGCVAFYASARRLIRSPLAELGALLYATAFFAWFSGNVHSTYASQLLFAPLTFYFMLLYRENSKFVWLVAVAVSFALGAGFRPSDGVFLSPLLLLFALRLPRKRLLLLGLLVLILCAAWMIPNQIALHQYQSRSASVQLAIVAKGSIVFGRINVYTVSNALRFFLPLALALGPCVLFLFRSRASERLLLWAWVIPGSVFFLLIYVSDAPYLNFLLGGYLLLCLLGMRTSQKPRLAASMLILTILINTFFYLGFRPLSLHSNVYDIAEKDLGLYSFYAVRHQWKISRLSLEK